MNQHQRKFLLEAIEKQYRTEKTEIDAAEPEPPSLNNYMIAAILDGSFRMKSPEALRDCLTERVRKLGKSESLIQTAERYGRRRSRQDADEDMVNVPATVLFEMPEAYQQSLDAFEAAHREWQGRVKKLEASIQAMRIKVQIGSDKALETLVQEVDTLCSIFIAEASKLLLKYQ